MNLGLSDDKKSVKETKESVFGAVSLSKTIFAYLVLKLIQENKLNKDKLAIGKFNLPPELKECSDKESTEKLTARIILSHQTGIPHSHEGGPPTFNFSPGERYEYNGLPYFYLQIAIERLTGSSLEELARKFVFDRDACNMTDSTFLLLNHKFQ